MMTRGLRRLAVGAVPAVLAVEAVAGCNNGAPAVQAPPATTTATAASTASSTSSGVPTVAPTSAGGSSGTGVPTVSAQPTTSSGGDPSKVCTTQDNYDTPAVLAPSTKKTSWGKPLDVTQQYEGTVTMTAAKPVAKKPAADDIFGPQHGQVYLLVKVTVKYKSGNASVFGGTDFTLRDAHNNVCDSDSISDIVPQREQFDVVTIGKGKATSYTGTLVFEVPAGQDYTKYTFLYLPGLSQKSDAPVAWTH